MYARSSRHRRTYMHTHIPVCKELVQHTCIHTLYTHTCMQGARTYMHTHIHACKELVHTCTHIHVCKELVHICIHTCMYARSSRRVYLWRATRKLSHLGSSHSLTCLGYGKGEDIYKHTHARVCRMMPTHACAAGPTPRYSHIYPIYYVCTAHLVVGSRKNFAFPTLHAQSCALGPEPLMLART